ncbi:TetR/AcrR family transcriptional regulator [Candidatus Poribacteria bacterium]|nr:TetR/AcrR family transcriptional regulator [Candidatus Poribacteria bacterium]
MSIRSSRPQVEKPKQKRGWRTREHLVRAATQLFSEQGYDTTTTNQISRKARVSVGIFYKYFRDKRDIFLEIYREYSTRVVETLVAELAPERWRTADIQTAIQSLVRTAYESHKVDPGIRRAFAQVAMKDPAFREIRDEIRRRVRAPLERLLEEHRSEITVSNIPIAAFVIDEAVEACVHQVIFSQAAFNGDELVQELARMVSHYLIHPRN